MTARLRSATLQGAELELCWMDERPSLRLPLLWLRDHCPGPETTHPQTGQRLADTFAFPQPLQAREVTILESGRVLQIQWSQETHASRFDATFLSQLRAAPERLPVERLLWDRDSIMTQLPQVNYEELMQREHGLKQFLELIERYGFCFVEQSPPTPEATRAVAERVAYIRQTVFGGYYDFTANLEHKDTAYTSLSIGPHTDGTYSIDAPGYQIFHCLAADCSGGENLLIDGFKVAELLERSHPQDYQLLSTIEIPGQHIDHERGIHLMARRPLLRLDRNGELQQVSYNNHDRAPFLLPGAQQQRFYEALARFAALCADPALQYRRRLLPGSILMFDNWRLLHARDAYQGYRRLAGAYLNKEDLHSRLRVLRLRAGEPV
jgi:trimethyllysine dioxygenase